MAERVHLRGLTERQRRATLQRLLATGVRPEDYEPRAPQPLGGVHKGLGVPGPRLDQLAQGERDSD